MTVTNQRIMKSRRVCSCGTPFSIHLDVDGGFLCFSRLRKNSSNHPGDVGIFGESFIKNW